MNQLANISGFSVSLIILSAILFYYAFYYLINSEFPEKITRVIKNQVKKELILFFLKKSAGFIILGLIPGVIYFTIFNRNFGEFGLSPDYFSNNAGTIFSLVTAIVLILLLNQRKNKQHNSLQINLKEWSIFLFLLNTAGWTIYLSGYEFLFRGILLFECFKSFGFWPAIAINATLYSALHMVYGKDQTFGALIFGIIACYFTLSRGTILIPIIMHVALSVFSDFFSILYNEKLSFIKQIRFNPQKR